LRSTADCLDLSPLSAPTELFGAVLASGLRIEGVEEPGEKPIPVVLAISARRVDPIEESSFALRSVTGSS
jgi:hypothetical protein